MRFTFVATVCVISVTSLSAQEGGRSGDPNPVAVQIGSLDGIGVVPADSSRRVAPEERPAPRLDKRVVNRVAATVNGRPITSSEVTFRMMPILYQLATIYPKQGQEFNRQMAIAKKEIINDLVERELVLSEFDSKGYMIRDSNIDQEINRVIIEEANGNRDLFLKNLAKSGMTLREFRDVTKKRLIVSIMRASKYDPEIPPTPDEINKEYQETKHMYRDLTKDQIKFKKIFIPLMGETASQTPEVQYELSQLIMNEIKGKKATFEEMARRYSRDQMAQEGGDWPMTDRGRLAPEFSAIVFDTPEGEIAGPLADNYGFMIVLVQKKILAPAPPLAKVKEQVDAQVRTKRSNERYKQWIDRLRQKAIIKTYI